MQGVPRCSNHANGWLGRETQVRKTGSTFFFFAVRVGIVCVKKLLPLEASFSVLNVVYDHVSMA